MLAVVTQNGMTLQYADANLKNNKEVVLVAVKQVGGAWYHASDSIKNTDAEVALAALEELGARGAGDITIGLKYSEIIKGQ